MHMMDPAMIELAMRTTPFVMVASDGMPYAPGAHPRSAGTFSRVLGRYVRDQGSDDAERGAQEDHAHACRAACRRSRP